MLRFVYTSAFILLFGLCSLHAQTQLGFGLAYGNDIEEGGIVLKGNFGISGKVSFSPNLTYFFVDGDRRFSTLNGNFHWNFKVGDNLILYPLLGAQISFYRRDKDDDESDTDLGINLGGGGMTAITESMLLFFELKGTLADEPADQAVVAIGLLFNL